MAPEHQVKYMLRGRASITQKSMATECSCDNKSKYIGKINNVDPKLKNYSFFFVNYEAIILITEPLVLCCFKAGYLSLLTVLQ